MPSPTPPRGPTLAALIALTMLAFAANSVLNRLAVAGGTDPVAFGAIRLASGALLLLALAARRGRVRLGGRGRAAGTGALLLYIFGFSAAYAALDTGLGALILFGCVQITMFAGAWLGGEPIPPRRWAGAGIAFAGLVLLLWPSGAAAPSPWHAALMAAAGLGWGLYSLAGRRAADPLAETAANFACAAPVALLAWLVLGGGVPVAGAVLAVLSGAIASGLGYALWYSLLPRLPAALAAIAQLTVPLIATAGGVVLVGESVGVRFALATVLVLGGLGVSLVRRRG
ncbi:membrane protein, putative [Oceanicola granulosus HTCC2516]|uniref:Membrane protein, putative n=1 Tax=Oceanicola granulosus (strain ATCC BAA-861 / DSM 15982 / KCTC 12143 / HTCC2516) TaxID=314256 RepID=Q2CK55_OCEGH|nr:DMT family transporter [Oceanicola granulosus]EAR52934.1 membrane protein, putative [Oceanicola granulosus HTCC2516]